MTKVNLKEALESGVVNFTFKKANGETRKAVGTTNPSILKTHNAVPNGDGIAPAGTIPFFDLEKKEWRSTRANAVLSVDSVEQA